MNHSFCIGSKRMIEIIPPRPPLVKWGWEDLGQDSSFISIFNPQSATINPQSMFPDRIYLDNAATSFPKPAAVHDAVAVVFGSECLQKILLATAQR